MIWWVLAAVFIGALAGAAGLWFVLREYRPLPPGGTLGALDQDAQDALYIWQRACAGMRTSRAFMLRAGLMSAYRWNRAYALLKYLELDPKSPSSYDIGRVKVERETARRAGLAAQGQYVDPY